MWDTRVMSDEFSGWRKSSHSGGGNTDCVEVGHGPAVVGIRDSKQDGTGAVLTFTASAWETFTATLTSHTLWPWD